MSTKDALQQLFLQGSVAKNLDGFYKGRLTLFIPESIVEFLAGLIAKVWLPWYGKEFDKKEQRGNNVLPSYMASFISYRYGNSVIVSEKQNTIHVFPFQTKIKQGLGDKIEVLQLDYDLPENPKQVRNVVDELVAISENEYLGKAYLKEKKDLRLVAFFSLRK